MDPLDERTNEGCKISEKAINDLNSTRTWLLTAGVIYLIFAVVTILGGLLAMGNGGGMGIVNIAMGGISIAVNIALINQASAIKSFFKKRNEDDFEKFVTAFKNYWSMQGVIAVMVALIVICFIMFMLSDPRALDRLF